MACKVHMNCMNILSLQLINMRSQLTNMRIWLVKHRIWLVILVEQDTVMHKSSETPSYGPGGRGGPGVSLDRYQHCPPSCSTRSTSHCFAQQRTIVIFLVLQRVPTIKDNSDRVYESCSVAPNTL